MDAARTVVAMEYAIRPVRAREWAKAKEIRLESLLDPAAGIAFLETHTDAAAKPDSVYRERTERASAGETSRQLIAEAADGQWLGTVTLIVERPGVESLGEIPEVAQTHIVAVYVRPEARGTGLAEHLIRAGVEWSWGLTDPRVERVRLWVHQDNARAEALYRKAGFVRTGASTAFPTDPTAVEYELAISRQEARRTFLRPG